MIFSLNLTVVSDFPDLNSYKFLALIIEASIPNKNIFDTTFLFFFK